MKVYRIEHVHLIANDGKRISSGCGHGPYNCNDPDVHVRIKKEQYLYDHRRPSPKEDGIDPNFKGSFGFVSKEQMCAWFRRRTVKWLLDQGHRIIEYEVNPDLVRAGGHQCLFLKKHAYSRRIIPLK